MICRLAKTLNKFEMKATYEDVYQTQHPNVQEYLKHVQQATLLTAIHVRLLELHLRIWPMALHIYILRPCFACIQEAQKDAVSAFDDFMDQAIESDWARDRAKLVNAIMPIGNTAGRQHSARPASSPHAATNGTLLLTAANGVHLRLTYQAAQRAE